MKNLGFIKDSIETHKAKFHKKKAFPAELWEEIVKLSEKIPPSKIAEELGISYGNLARQLKKRKNVVSPKESDRVSMVEFPSSMLGIGGKKQMTIELPNNIVLRIDL